MSWRQTLLIPLSLGLVLAAPAMAAAEVSLTAGHRLAAQQCGACHAVDERDQSPNPRAPRFRDLGGKYPLEDLGEALAEGMIVGHARMPVVTLSQREIQDLIAYLHTLQRPAEKSRPAQPVIGS